MLVNNARTVSEALNRGLHLLHRGGIEKPSRVGSVLVSSQPVMTVYEDPTNRVLFSPLRNANPYFHVMETLWMLAGRDDLPWLVRFNSRFKDYSDDGGITQPGAYGYRWRNYFGHDQLQDIILELKRNPDTRRAVLAMWDGGSRGSWGDNVGPHDQPGDFYAAVMGSKDVPCNTHAYFDTIDRRLNMTVCCRSNDIIWGAYGANAVHFSFLLEYMAAATGIPMGVYRQFSNNFHIYTEIVSREDMIKLADDVRHSDKYLNSDGYASVPAKPALYKIPLVYDREEFDVDLEKFMSVTPLYQTEEYTEPFFKLVAVPMLTSYLAFKDGRVTDAIDVAMDIKADDWRIACVEWMQRRKEVQDGAA